MFYVHSGNKKFEIVHSRISKNDEEFETYRGALACLQFHRGIVLTDNILDKYFPKPCEQLSL